MPTSYLNNASVPRGIRNNNPGNLRRTSITWLGKIPFTQSHDASFEQFIEMRYGIRALMRDLISDFKDGKDTIRAIISEFAPPNENNTIAYMNSVASSLGITPDTTIAQMSALHLKTIAKAIIRVENGSVADQYVKDQDYSDAFAILGIDLGTIVKKKKLR